MMELQSLTSINIQQYNKELRPFIEEVQTEAVKVGLESLVPKTEEVIRKRNTTGF